MFLTPQTRSLPCQTVLYSSSENVLSTPRQLSTIDTIFHGGIDSLLKILGGLQPLHPSPLVPMLVVLNTWWVKFCHFLHYVTPTYITPQEKKQKEI